MQERPVTSRNALIAPVREKLVGEAGRAVRRDVDARRQEPGVAERAFDGAGEVDRLLAGGVRAAKAMLLDG
jgi:hypothetical protein